MGWPRKNDEMRLYRDRDGSYFLIEICREQLRYGGYDALANVMEGAKPSLGSCSISPGYLAEKRPTRVEWWDLPEEWQRAFLQWFDDDFDPTKVRGFFKVEHWPIKPLRAPEPPDWRPDHVIPEDTHA